MAQSEQKTVNINQYKLPGMRTPRNRLAPEKPVDGKKTVKRLVKYFASEKYTVITLLVIVLIVVICSVYAPSLQSQAIDNISAGKYDSLNRILLKMAAVYVIYSIGTLFQGRISALLSQRIVSTMRTDLFDRIVNLPVSYLDVHAHGDIMSRMTNDVENISNTVSQSLSSLFSGILTIIGTVVMMLLLCPQLTVLSCLTVILTLCATRFLSSAMRRFYSKKQALLGGLNSTVEEMVGSYRTVMAYNRQESVIAEFEKNSDELTKTGILAEILGGSMGPVMNVINNVGFVIIAAFGGYFAINGVISIGVISAFIVYAKQFGRPIDELAQIYGQIQTAIAGAERVFAVMDEEPEDKSGNDYVEASKGNIEFKNVNFSYEAGKPVIKNFNLSVGAGKKVALVGATGSGKTTIVNLLMRFYDIDSGEILIDGVNIDTISRDELRKNIAIVLQDTILFADTIKNNLRYSNENATDEQVMEAARISNCDNMIKRLSDGYDTVLAPSGANLSQGQRQLLSIARAFIANPRILILDEATSSVDTRTEKHIQDAMVKLMQNRTSIIIAHRLSTIHDADSIVVMDNGRIAEIGNHDELMEKKGRYYNLYMTQFAGNEI